MVSAFYGNAQSSHPVVGNNGADDAPGFLTANGSRDSHAVTLADGRANGSPRAGTPYRTVTWADIRALVEAPANRPKDQARLVVLSSYVAPDGRTHAVQREQGLFHGLAVDIDKGSPSVDDVVAAVQRVTGGCRAEVYSSSSARPDNRKWRVLIPLASPVAGADYADTQLALFTLLGQHGLECDTALSRPAQPVYLPNVPPEKRGDDGQPLFYVFRHIDGPTLTLTATHDIVVARDTMRQQRAADEAAAAVRAKQHESQRLAYVEATGDDFDPIRHFNDHNTVADMLARYGFVPHPQRPTHYRHPESQGGSFATEDRGGHWVCLSAWAHTLDIGRPTKNGHRAGDAFDLFAHFEHGGSRSAAVRAYAAEVRPRRPVDVDRPVPVEAAPVENGQPRTLADWRDEAATRRAAAVARPGMHMDRSPTGSGKTHATIVALRQASSSLTVLPTHANVVERVAEMQALGVDAVPFPELTDANCQNFAAASKAQSLGLVAGAAVCPGCEFKKQCTYRAAVKAAESAQHRVGTHERLRRSSRAADGVQVVVIDEVPESVVAPTLTITLREVTAVETLARAIRDHFYVDATMDQKSFAGALLDVVTAIRSTCEASTTAGTAPVDLTVPHTVPERWQQLLFRWIQQVGVGQDLHADALTLVTKAAAGELLTLNVVTDLTRAGRLVHFVVGSWRPSMPAESSVILLDATGDAADVAAVIGRPVDDCTPDGHLTPHHPVVQITDDISRGTSAGTVAGVIDGFLTAHPNVQRLGIIGHKPHIEALIDGGLLGSVARERVVKWCYFGEGPDRASNSWHVDCDHLLVLGTPRANPGDYRRWLVQHGLHEAAGRLDGDWGARNWQTTTTAGEPITVAGMGYRDPDWHRAYVAVSRSTLQQSVGRGRSILTNGIPVTVMSSEATGYPVAPSLPVSPAAARETVEILRNMGNPPSRPLLAGSAKSPIGNLYSENCASGPWPTAACVAAIRDAAGVEERAAQIRLQQCRDAGLLTQPKRGWWALPGGAADPVPEPVPVPRVAAPAPRPAVVMPPVQSLVISATGPAAPAPAVDVVAECAPAVTTATCTSTVTPTKAPPDVLLGLIEERAAILEFDAGMDRDVADRLAREMILGRDSQPSPTGPAADIVVAVDHASLHARERPAVSQALRYFPGTVRLIGDRDDPFAGRRPQPETKPGTCRCGHDDWRGVPIHGGQSTRVDCGRCDRFGWFSVWYGKRLRGPFDDIDAGTADRATPEANRLSFPTLPTGPVPAAVPVG